MELNVKKVEERALRLFPVEYVNDGEDVLVPFTDANFEKREAYIKGWKDALLEINDQSYFWQG